MVGPDRAAGGLRHRPALHGHQGDGVRRAFASRRTSRGPSSRPTSPTRYWQAQSSLLNLPVVTGSSTAAEKSGVHLHGRRGPRRRERLLLPRLLRQLPAPLGLPRPLRRQRRHVDLRQGRDVHRPHGLVRRARSAGSRTTIPGTTCATTTTNSGWNGRPGRICSGRTVRSCRWGPGAEPDSTPSRVLSQVREACQCPGNGYVTIAGLNGFEGLYTAPHSSLPRLK